MQLTTLLDRPALAILALTAACLVAFGATVPLPRVDDALIGSDGIRYYVYLPSLLIDGDLDFTDEYLHFYRSYPETAAYLVADRTPTDLPANRFGIGPAILWAPFFIAAHLVAALLQALGWSLSTDGYSAFYQVPVLAGSILYGGLGAWLCFRTALRIASQPAALAATLLTVLAGNLLYYLTVEPSMSHPLSMFASAAFFYMWLATPDRLPWGAPALGGLAGLMALIRPQDGLFLALPIASAALSTTRTSRDAWAKWLKSSLLMVAAAALVFLPQLLVWRLLNGGFLRSGYSEEFGALFHWPFPHLFDVLFSAQRGLFTWHPIFLLSLAGLGLVLWCGPNRRDSRFAAAPGLRAIAVWGVAGFVVQWVVVSSWHEWQQGDAFGGRMFIVCSPSFVFGLASLLDFARCHWSWRRLLACGAVLVLLNCLLIIQYRVELLALSQEITATDMTIGRFRMLAGYLGAGLAG